MKTFPLLLFLSGSLCGTAQSFSFPGLLRDAICSIRDEPVITYVNSSMTFYKPLTHFAHKGRVTGYVDLRGGSLTSMPFSKAELEQIDPKMTAAPSQTWPLQLFPGSVRMPSDSTHLIPHYMRRPEFLREKRYWYYYHFNTPVTIRNGTVVLFRLAEMIHHSGGYDFHFIYERRPEGWKRKMTISPGAW